MTGWTPKLLLSYMLFLVAMTGVSAQYVNMAGVAFELTPDYGVAAVCLPDGTTVPIARIQGSPSYQAFMRKNSTTATTNNESSMLCRILSPALDRLPPRFGLDICRNADVTAAKTLLAALKRSVELYLGTNICFAAISLYDRDRKEIDAAQEALQALGLRQVRPTIPAEEAVLVAHKPNHSPAFDEEPWIFLAVGSISRWFNIGLYTFGEDMIDPIEGFVRGPIIEEHNQVNALGDALQDLFANPPRNVTLPDNIHRLVLYGDNKGEDVLDLLKTVVGADLLANAIISNSVFDGAMRVAETVRWELDTIDFEWTTKPVFGCQWRSEFFRKGRVEL